MGNHESHNLDSTFCWCSWSSPSRNLIPFSHYSQKLERKVLPFRFAEKDNDKTALSFLRALWRFLSWEHFSVAGTPVNVALILALENYFRCRTVSAYSYPLGRDPVQKCLPPLSALHWKETKQEIKPQTHKSSYEKLWNNVPVAFGRLSNQEIITPQIKQRAIVTLIFTVSHHKVI